jgi:hypothetical protein
MPSTLLTPLAEGAARTGVALVLLSTLAASAGAWASPFQKRLSLQGVSFAVQAKGDGSQQTLLVQTSGQSKRWQTIRETIDGTVVGAEVEDLNRDGMPELLLYTTSAGSGSYGSVLSWVSTKKGTLLPIFMPELSGKAAQGYQGHDRFSVIENSLSRRFPIYKPGDSNASPSGGLRQINYSLIPGEAGWLWKVRSMDQF